MIKSFLCALIATVTLQIIDPYHGKTVLFEVTYTRDWHSFELIFFALLGCFGGLTGALFIQLNLKAQQWRTHIFKSSHPVIEVTCLTLATTFVFFLNGFTQIDSSELLERLFRECSESDFNGLCNIPSMIWGALFGRIVGIVVESYHAKFPSALLFASCLADQPCVTPGVYSLLGAMAGLGGVTRLTITLSVIMFELTGSLRYVIPCMITVSIAKLVGDVFGKGSYADKLIQLKGYPYLNTREDELLGFLAKDVMTGVGALTCIKASGVSVRELRMFLLFPVSGLPVVGGVSGDDFVGCITLVDLRDALETDGQTDPASVVCFSESPTGTLNFHRYMDKASITVSRSTSVEFIIDVFKRIGPKYIIVCDKSVLAGLITKKDILVELDGGSREHGFTSYASIDATGTEEDSLSAEGDRSEVSWSRRVRKWRVLTKPNE